MNEQAMTVVQEKTLDSGIRVVLGVVLGEAVNMTFDANGVELSRTIYHTGPALALEDFIKLTTTDPHPVVED